MNPLLEICVFNIETAIEAQRAGADRIELCENYANGGTTPSYGFLKEAKEKLALPVFPMIRPRGGDFCYSKHELNIMKKDILLCKEIGFEGIVIGLLHYYGTIDKENLLRLIDLAYPMDVTFHRAFDRCKEPLSALETIIECGCSRILTSGQKPKAVDGKELIQKLIEQADERIMIMPGSGINSSNISEICQFTKAIEFHSSARIMKPSLFRSVNPEITEELSFDFTEAEEIVAMKKLLIQCFN